MATSLFPALGSNASSASPAFPSAYVPLIVNQVDTSGGSAASGPLARVSTVSPSFVPISDPTAPFANQNGLVASPNIDLANELVQLLMAQVTFATNTKVLTADNNMSKVLLNVLA